MKNKIIALTSITAFAGGATVYASVLPDTVLITGSSNSVDITQMTYNRNGSTVVQNSSATGTEATLDSVILKNVKINDNGAVKDLKFFNFGGQINNLNLSPNVKGVGVIKNGVRTTIEDNGVGAFKTALQGTLNDTDINDYVYYDNIPAGVMPASDVADYDIIFPTAFKATDYIAVTERNGNTFFNLTALDQQGNVISDANILQFNSDTGSVNHSGNPGGYDWNTGISTAGWQSSQPQWMTIANAGLFGSNTDVYGFRIDNNGEADVKFFGISDTSFVSTPEPSSTALLGIGCFALLARRKRS